MNLNEYIESKHDEHLSDLYELLRIPSVSAQSQHKPDIARAAEWVAERMRRAGLDPVELVSTKMHPLVYGESLKAPGKPTVLFYGHYDVQPPEPLDLWTSPAFEPTIRGGNLFARGTADDKGQIHIHLRALEALKQVTGQLPINVKVLIEGEEEVGSESLWDYVQKNKAKLKADALIVSDTSMLAPGVPSITYGLRGLNYYEIEITGPAQDLHSGVFGVARCAESADDPRRSFSPSCMTKTFAWPFPAFMTMWQRFPAVSASLSMGCRLSPRISARRWALPVCAVSPGTPSWSCNCGAALRWS